MLDVNWFITVPNKCILPIIRIEQAHAFCMHMHANRLSSFFPFVCLFFFGFFLVFSSLLISFLFIFLLFICNALVDISFSFHFLCCLFCISPNIFIHYSLFSFFYKSMNAVSIVILNVSFLMFSYGLLLIPYLIFFISFFSFLFHSLFLFS